MALLRSQDQGWPQEGFDRARTVAGSLWQSWAFSRRPLHLLMTEPGHLHAAVNGQIMHPVNPKSHLHWCKGRTQASRMSHWAPPMSLRLLSGRRCSRSTCSQNIHAVSQVHPTVTGILLIWQQSHQQHPTHALKANVRPIPSACAMQHADRAAACISARQQGLQANLCQDHKSNASEVGLIRNPQTERCNGMPSF